MNETSVRKEKRACEKVAAHLCNFTKAGNEGSATVHPLATSCCLAQFFVPS
jgi:hypothetical protein